MSTKARRHIGTKILEDLGGKIVKTAAKLSGTDADSAWRTRIESLARYVDAARMSEEEGRVSHTSR
jgi:hypothetical protein